MSTNAMAEHVYRTRRMEYQDFNGVISSGPLSLCQGDPRKFLQFDAKINVTQADGSESVERILGWADARLKTLMMGIPRNLFIDCTFYCVPREGGFSQCLIVMFYEGVTKKYIPVFYILIGSKLQKVYKTVLYLLKQSCNFDLTVLSKTCDFEKGLMNAIEDELVPEDAPLIGCLFHFLKALRDYMLFWGIPVVLVNQLSSMMRLLTEIPIADIKTKGIITSVLGRGRWFIGLISLLGIPYLRSKTEEGTFVEVFNKFWRYFVKTWIKTYKPEYWNVFGVEDRAMVNRTNNALERFNGIMKSNFSTAHPNMSAFVTTIREMSADYAQEYTSILLGHTKKGKHGKSSAFEFPADYEDFVAAEL